MPSTQAELIDFYRRAFGERIGGPEAMLAAQLDKLDSIVATLKSSPIASSIRIFGSAVHAEHGMVPGDIDVFLEAPFHVPLEERGPAIFAILELTEGDNYGFLDAFRLVKPQWQAPVLLVRGEARVRNQWVGANKKSADAIVEAGRAGIPILEFERRFRDEYERTMEAMPN
jgi:hypothetical protein